jgi:hypothetical protein
MQESKFGTNPWKPFNTLKMCYVWDIRGFNCNQNSSHGLLGCDAMQLYGKIPTFRRTLMKIQVVLRVMTRFGHMAGYQHFGTPRCLHLQHCAPKCWNLNPYYGSTQRMETTGSDYSQERHTAEWKRESVRIIRNANVLSVNKAINNSALGWKQSRGTPRNGQRTVPHIY